MDLGKIFTVSQFTRSEQTTWIIDKFYKCIRTGEAYDTVKLGWVLSIIDNNTIYPISLFIKYYAPNCDRACEKFKFNKRFCGTTFSNLKYRYAGRGFKVDDCANDILLNKIHSAWLSSKANESDNFIEFDTPYCFKAQSSYAHESDGFGRSTCCYIVGISVGKSFKIPK